MKSLVFSAFGTWGDLAPMVEIAEQFRLLNTGIEVVFLANPYFETQIKSRGFPFYPIMTLEDHLSISGNQKMYGPGTQGLDLTLPFLRNAIRPVYEWITKNTDPLDTVLFVNGNVIGAVVASEAKGYPLVVEDVGASMLWSIYDPPRLPQLSFLFHVPPFARAWIYRLVNVLLDRKISPSLSALRQTLGLPGKVTGILTDYLNRAHLRLGLWPKWLAEEQPDWPAIEPVGFPFHDLHKGFSPELAKFLDEGEPFVVFTAGSANYFTKTFFRSALEAVRLGGYRAVFIGPADQMPGELPPTVFQTDWAPFGKLFRRVTAVVHPGAMGTGAFAARAGVPQLLFPLGFDQLDNTMRFTRLGIAKDLEESAYREGVFERIAVRLGFPFFRCFIQRRDRRRGCLIAERLKALLSDESIQRNCADIRQRIERDPPGGLFAAQRLYQFIRELESDEAMAPNKSPLA